MRFLQDWSPQKVNFADPVCMNSKICFFHPSCLQSRRARIAAHYSLGPHSHRHAISLSLTFCDGVFESCDDVCFGKPEPILTPPLVFIQNLFIAAELKTPYFIHHVDWVNITSSSCSATAATVCLGAARQEVSDKIGNEAHANNTRFL